MVLAGKNPPMSATADGAAVLGKIWKVFSSYGTSLRRNKNVLNFQDEASKNSWQRRQIPCRFCAGESWGSGDEAGTHQCDPRDDVFLATGRTKDCKAVYIFSSEKSSFATRMGEKNLEVTWDFKTSWNTPEKMIRRFLNLLNLIKMTLCPLKLAHLWKEEHYEIAWERSHRLKLVWSALSNCDANLLSKNRIPLWAVCFYAFISIYLFIYLFIERGEGREKEKERNIDAPWTSVRQPRQEVKLAPLRFRGRLPTNWATPVRASSMLLKELESNRFCRKKDLISFIKYVSSVNSLYEVDSCFALANKWNNSISNIGIGKTFVKENMRHQKRHKRSKCCYRLFMVKCKIDLKSELAKIIWTSVAKSKSEK